MGLDTSSPPTPGPRWGPRKHSVWPQRSEVERETSGGSAARMDPTPLDASVSSIYERGTGTVPTSCMVAASIRE